MLFRRLILRSFGSKLRKVLALSEAGRDGFNHLRFCFDNFRWCRRRCGQKDMSRAQTQWLLELLGMLHVILMARLVVRLYLGCDSLFDPSSTASVSSQFILQ